MLLYAWFLSLEVTTLQSLVAIGLTEVTTLQMLVIIGLVEEEMLSFHFVT